MSTRLQIVMNEEELEQFRELAERAGLSLSEWVRRRLREAAREADVGDSRAKLAAIRRASRHQFPTADIDQMLAEIASGYDQ